MTSNEIRSSFLEYFRKNGHRVVPSSPLVPADDPTLLFTNAGMNQFKDLFLGREKRDYTRATTSQKVMRVSGKHNDLDNVGPSFRHHTFFEMLGNFSFGDYFKKDALPFAWTLLTDVWKMPADRLVVSIFKGEAGIPRDEEAYEVWRSLGVPADRIMELGLDDNFWQMGDTGPCGRCSEIYFVRGSGTDPEIEIWNNVFMEFERSADGTLTPLPAPSIDTGMGLERVTSVLQNKQSNYDTDVFMPLLVEIGKQAGHLYTGTMSAPDVSLRVVADHIRATTFLIADGVIPSNEWRGYVLRKIMRRAMRHGKHLGFTEPFLHGLVAVIDREMGDAYPEVRRDRGMIEKTILAEEHRFEAVLTEGLPRLEAEIAKALDTPQRALPGDAAFKLYDTFGVPYDFIEDTAATQDVKVDKAGFDQAMEGQRDKARAGSAFGGGKKEEEFAVDDEQLKGAGDRFEGYTMTSLGGVPVIALFDERRQPVGGAVSRSEGLRRAPADAVLSRGRRAGLRFRPNLQRGQRRVGDGRRAGADPAGAAACPPCPRRRRPPAASRHRDGGGRRRGARLHAKKSHRHASAPCGPAHGARHARQTGGIARRAGPSALRLRALSAGHARGTGSHRADRQRADLPQHHGHDRGAIDAGSDRGRRDGAVRREVRRPGARRERPRLQPRVVRRHPRARHRRHRLLRDRGGGRGRGRRATHRGRYRRRSGRVGAAPACRADRHPRRPAGARGSRRRGHRQAPEREQTPGARSHTAEDEAGHGRRSRRRRATASSRSTGSSSRAGRLPISTRTRCAAWPIR